MASNPMTTSQAKGTQAASRSPPRSISLRWYFRTKASSFPWRSCGCRAMWVSPSQGPCRVLRTLKLRRIDARISSHVKPGARSRVLVSPPIPTRWKCALLENLSSGSSSLALLCLAASGASLPQPRICSSTRWMPTATPCRTARSSWSCFGDRISRLDGHIVVFYKGGGNTNTSTAYAAFDLDGFQTDSAGFFLLANPQVGGGRHRVRAGPPSRRGRCGRSV